MYTLWFPLELKNYILIKECLLEYNEVALTSSTS